jgi:mRNA interferase YafQ
MRTPAYTNRFKKDLKLMVKRGHDPERIKRVIRDLIEEKILDQKYRDHILIGNFQYRRECHVEPDWLLIYRIDEPRIIFERTGTHADLFK